MVVSVGVGIEVLVEVKVLVGVEVECYQGLICCSGRHIACTPPPPCVVFPQVCTTLCHYPYHEALYSNMYIIL